MIFTACYSQGLPYHCMYSHDIDTIKIDNDTLKLIRYIHQQRKDTLAICSLKHIDGIYYEINSIGNQSDSIFAKMKVEQYTTGIKKDGIIVYFKFPQWTSPNIRYDNVIIGTESDSENTTNYSGKYIAPTGTAIIIPHDKKNFSFYIADEKRNRSTISITETPDGRNLALNVINSPQIDIRDGVDMIFVTIPGLSFNRLFYNYYINGEYMIITPTDLKWRGETYRRITD